MTGNELVTEVRSLMDDDQYPAATIIRNGNWVVNELYSSVRTRKMETSDVINVAQGDTTAPFPSNIQTILDIGVTSPQPYSIKQYRVDGEVFTAKYPKWRTSSQNAIRWWTDFGNQMRFFAPVSAASVIAIDYLRTPVQVGSDGTGSYELGSMYDELLAKRTLRRCMMGNEDYEEAREEEASVAALAIAFVKNEGRGQLMAGGMRMRSTMGVGWDNDDNAGDTGRRL